MDGPKEVWTSFCLIFGHCHIDVSLCYRTLELSGHRRESCKSIAATHHGRVAAMKAVALLADSNAVGAKLSLTSERAVFNMFLRSMCTQVFGLVLALVIICSAWASAPTTETMIFVRHGEKPASGENGQLTCQGQNRATALPAVLIPRYGNPDYVFAAEPVENQDDDGVNYWYLRAMATIEPTAVAAGVTINLNYDKDDIDDVETELNKSSYADSLVFVAWEHDELDQLVVNLVHDNGGDSSVVPAWNDDDYDSIFVVTITRGSGQNAVVFSHDQEGLDGQSTSCAVVPRPIRYILPANSIIPP